MSVTELEANIMAYYVNGAANDLDITGRFYPHGELVMIIADKIQVVTRKFGRKANAASRAAATEFVDYMVVKGGWSSKANDFGGTMHQFQGDVYKVALKELQASDPICVEARAGGESFWADRFAALTA